MSVTSIVTQNSAPTHRKQASSKITKPKLAKLFRKLFTARSGRAIAEAVSRWIPTTAARVRAQVWQVGLWWTKWRRGRFFPSTSVSPAKNRSFHQLLHHHHNHPGQLADALRRADHPSKESCRLS
jgi:hypothetical protein